MQISSRRKSLLGRMIFQTQIQWMLESLDLSLREMHFLCRGSVSISIRRISRRISGKQPVNSNLQTVQELFQITTICLCQRISFNDTTLIHQRISLKLYVHRCCLAPSSSICIWVQGRTHFERICEQREIECAWIYEWVN